jgi:hypothetical protein
LPLFIVLAAQSGRSSRRAVGSIEDAESECGRLVGTVRRYVPIDTRDPIGAIIHFYVGDSFDSSRYNSVGNVMFFSCSINTYGQPSFSHHSLS